MLFNSWQFIFVFLPVALVCFHLIPPAHVTGRKLLLLGASMAFYGWWNWRYVFLLAISIALNYFLAGKVAKSAPPRKKQLLTIGVGLNLLLLGYYKYTNFFVDQWEALTGRATGFESVILPLAISFFTFTQIAYLVDVYRDPKVHPSFLDFALFVYLFPHLIAGPILRHWEIIPQFAGKIWRVTRRDAAVGLTLFLLGLFKKMFFADTLQPCADSIFNAAASGVKLSFVDAWLGAVAFGLQIYFDFSGYSDMAIGLARMFGIKFPLNFDSPYKSRSLIEFWRRWHVTLSRFFREYVYFPLGGSKKGKSKSLRNILVVMALSGIWHGAGWNFLLWGGIHGAFLVFAHVWKDYSKNWSIAQSRWYAVGAWGITFLVVTIAWIFFRAKDIPTAGSMLGSMFGGGGLSVPVNFTNQAKFFGQALQSIGFQFVPENLPLEPREGMFRIVLLLMIVVLVFPNTQQLLARYEPLLEPVSPSRFQLQLNGLTAFLLGIFFFFAVKLFFAAKASPFIYFNF